MTSLDLEVKDAFIASMVWVQTLIPDYVPEGHHTLAHGIVAAVFYVAYQGWLRWDAAG